MESQSDNTTSKQRREFLKKGGIYLGAAALTGSLIMCKGTNDEKEEKEEAEEMAPTEDLMREHGILNRVLLIYDDCIDKLKKNIDFSPEVIINSTAIIRDFIEDYHEKQEEQFLFPRFLKAGKMIDLVNTLIQQHQAGRIITDKIKHLSQASADKNNQDRITLAENLQLFIHFYRPHEAREDTVLFPALRSIISKHEFDSLGEDFEKNEHKLFGQDGFELYLNKVADIEKKLGIYDLSQFTPK